MPFLKPVQILGEATEPDTFAFDNWGGSTLEGIGNIHVPERKSKHNRESNLDAKGRTKDSWGIGFIIIQTLDLFGAIDTRADFALIEAIEGIQLVAESQDSW